MQEMKGKILPAQRAGYQRCKRLFDIIAALLALILLLPLMLLIALLIFLQDGGAPLYTQTRLGRCGKLIRIYKFRSMRRGAEEAWHLLSEAHLAQYRAEFKIDDDPRVTPLGRLLRKTSLDELPQLWNILRGELSFVGPRPILPEEIKMYSPEQQTLFLSVPPGLTGYWQACAGKNDTYTTGKRQQMELHYAAHAGILFDLKIILQTFVAVPRKALQKRA